MEEKAMNFEFAFYIGLTFALCLVYVLAPNIAAAIELWQYKRAVRKFSEAGKR